MHLRHVFELVQTACRERRISRASVDAIATWLSHRIIPFSCHRNGWPQLVYRENAQQVSNQQSRGLSMTSMSSPGYWCDANGAQHGFVALAVR
jgi:hypothetical protein